MSKCWIKCIAWEIQLKILYYIVECCCESSLKSSHCSNNNNKPVIMYSEVKSLSRVQLFATPWTVAYQAPPSMGFSRQKYWSGVPFPFPGDLPDPGIEPWSPAFQADTLTSEPPGKSWVAISFSSAWNWKVKVKSLSRVRLFATPWTAAHQASPSMGFSRQEYWSGVPLPSPDIYPREIKSIFT